MGQQWQRSTEQPHQAIAETDDVGTVMGTTALESRQGCQTAQGLLVLGSLGQRLDQIHHGAQCKIEALPGHGVQRVRSIAKYR
jgi:hypothetical protein